MILLLSLSLLLSGTFFLKNIRLGALAGIAAHIIYTLSVSGWTPVETGAVVNGVAITIELALLLFGAVAFYQFLLNNERLAFLDSFVTTSPDRSYLLIIYCIFLGSFFEGIAGFGVPPILLIPLLVRSGFKPLTSIVVALSGSVNAVIFGALGAPLTIGLGIDRHDQTIDILMFLNALSCFSMPFLLTYLYSTLENVRIHWRKLLIMHLGAGMIYFLLLLLASRFTVEYPSVIAGSLGMIIFMLLYNPAARTWGFKFWASSFWPYAVLILLLLTAKFALGAYSAVIPGAAKTISAYQPGLVFIFAIGVISMVFRLGRQSYSALPALGQAARRAMQSAFTILLLATFSQLVRLDMVDYIGAFIAGQPAGLEPFLLTSFGVLGAFITGSATMSNLLLNGLLSPAMAHASLGVAMLHTGSVLGNVISLQNIVMARSAVEKTIYDRDVLRYTVTTLMVCLACVFLSGVVWLIMVKSLNG